MRNPAWLGIGAQRCGTTWFTDLLVEHPQVALGTNEVKEQQLLHKVADGRAPEKRWRGLFPDDDLRRGDFSPQYLRHPSCARLVADLAPDAVVLVLLRDPVERFRSAMRLIETREQRPQGNRSQPYAIRLNVQTFAGMYADQLDVWAHFVGRERMHVLVHEQVRRDPQAAVDAVWGRLGLAPVPLTGVDRPSGSSSAAGAEWDFPDGMAEGLRALYRPQLDRLSRDWGLDVSDWSTTLA